MFRRMFCYAAATATVGLLGPAQGQNVTNQTRTVPGPNSGAALVQQKTVLDRRLAPPQSLLLGSPDVSQTFKPPAARAIETTTEPAVQFARPGLDSAASKAPQAGRMLRQGQEMQDQGDIAKALGSYEAAEAEARRAGDPTTAGVAALSFARAMQTKLGLATAPVSQWNQVVDGYNRAINDAPPADQALARNNLATLYLRQKNYGQAVSQLRAINWRSVEPAQVYLCRYNLGRAEELNGNPDGALQQYRLSIQQRPAFSPAVDGAFRLLIQSTNVDAVVALAEELVQQGAFDVLAHNLLTALEKISRAPDAPSLLVPLVECYVGQRLTPPQFDRQDRPLLSRTAELAPDLRLPTAGIARAFSADWVPSFSPAYTRELFPAWTKTDAQRNALSRLLQNVGDYLSHPTTADTPGSPNRALACYAGAWMLDPANTDAALYAAALLNEHKAELDSNGAALNELVQRLFELKGNAYAVPIKTRQDWLNLMRLHLVLASIYEKTGPWGPESRIDSAVFQLSRAARIEDLLRNADTAFVPSPDLYSRLARAYKRAGRPAEAWSQYLKAAEGFVFFHQGPQSAKALADASALQLALDADQTLRLQKVKLSLDNLSQP